MVHVIDHSLNGKNHKDADNPTQNSIYTMWIFSEIDNLEYAIEKYMALYMDKSHLKCVVYTFESRCKIPGFARSVIETLSLNNPKTSDNTIDHAGYNNTTIATIRKVISQIPE